MPYWNEDDTDNRLGYNKDSDGFVSKLNRLTGYSEDGNHGHEVQDTATGVYGYRGENADKSEFRNMFDDAKMPRVNR